MEDFQEEALCAQSVLSVFSHDGVPRGVGVQRGRRLEGGALGAAEVVRPGLHVRVRRRAAPGAGRALVRPAVALQMGGCAIKRKICILPKPCGKKRVHFKCKDIFWRIMKETERHMVSSVILEGDKATEKMHLPL